MEKFFDNKSHITRSISVMMLVGYGRKGRNRAHKGTAAELFHSATVPISYPGQCIFCGLYCVASPDCSVLPHNLAGKTKTLDLYQLRMYVDGCALDNKPVDEAVLIAKSHPAEVRELRDILNGFVAPNDRPYNFRLTTWDEEGIFVQQSA